ncbi:MAG TPA: DUF1513 domain-containing protein [Dongiaceae bacterium]|jgi:hypothetical protein|nr:DUF1513 domain-containing protein [Dongiaceae bacterium]
MRYFSACNFAPGPAGYGLAALDAAGRLLWGAPARDRGHTVEASPDGRLLALIDRKPGPAITLCNAADGAMLRRMAAPEGWHFDGHAVFSGDGMQLYATESRDGDQAGRIAVYRLADAARIAAFPSGGIEPHELIWAEADRVLAIGNGGLVDRLATEGEADSSLAFVDAETGALRASLRLDEDLVSLSIRHLARTADDEIVFAMQDQDPATDWRPLVGVARPDGATELLAMPRGELMKLRGYCGSVAIDRGRTIAAATSPHGGFAALWNVPERRYLGGVELRDGCGIAAADRPGRFVFTSGSGARVLIDASDGVTSQPLERPADGLPLWDNHLTAAIQ